MELENWEFVRVPVRRESLDEEEANEFLRCLWPFLRLFRFLGLCPVERNDDNLEVAHRICSFGWVCSISLLIIQAALICNVYLVPWNLHRFFFATSYFGHVVSASLLMTWNVRKFPEFLVACRRVEILLRKYRPTHGDGLAWDCFKLFVLFEVAHVSITVFHFVALAWQRGVHNLGEYFIGFNNHGIRNIGSYYTGIILCAAQLYTELGWNFGDVLLGLMAFIITRCFLRFNTWVRNLSRILKFDHIEELRVDHLRICELVLTCNKLFAPIFFLTLVGNMMYVFGRFNLVVERLTNDWTSISGYVVWSEILCRLGHQLVFRIWLPVYLASRLYEEACGVSKTIEEWPSFTGEEEEDEEGERNRLLLIMRFEDQLCMPKIGFCPHGHFFMQREFFVAMLSALLSISVIILQLHVS